MYIYMYVCMHIYIYDIFCVYVCHGMEWNGLEWNGMERKGMEWNVMYLMYVMYVMYVTYVMQCYVMLCHAT